MTLSEIIDLVEEIQELDGRRRETFGSELEAFEAGDATGFPETRTCIDAERDRLEDLGELLSEERDELEGLAEGTEFLSVDQAVRHREQAVAKLRQHNDHLEEFRASMLRALDTVASNLAALEADGTEDADLADAERHLRAAGTAIEDHNEAVADLDRNLMILDAYL